MTENQKTTPGNDRETDQGTDPLGRDGEALFTRTMVLDGGDESGKAQPEDRLQPGSLLRDRYLLQEQVSSGSMGVVYRALDRHLGHEHAADTSAATVAIKVLSPRLASHPEALRALQQEAAKGRCLHHPNIVRFLDLDREDQLYFLVLEWLEGESLADLLDRGSLADDLPRTLDILRQVGEALDYAHRRGVVHADVKPGNVMLLPDGTVKLIDFGIARVRQQRQEAKFDPVLFKAATPAYSSMQVLTGEDPVATDDVFSLACLAYRMIAGHRAFGPRNAAEAAEAGMEPQRLERLTDSQWKALKKGLAYSRVARQATPGELIDGLLQAGAVRPAADAADGDSLIIPASAVSERRFPARRSRWPGVVAAIVLLAIAGGSALYLRADWREAAVAVAAPYLTELQAAIDGDEAPADTPPPAEPAATPAEPPATAAGDSPDPAASDSQPAPVEDTETLPAGTPPEPESAGPAAAAEAPAAGDAAGNDRNVVSNTGSATASLVLAAPGAAHKTLDLALSEEGAALEVELYRWFGLAEPLLVRIDEIGFSGNRSPGEGGAYALSDDGVISFDPGQREATLRLSPTDNDSREPDRQVTLLLRDYYSAETAFGQIELRLLDDDQRRFEAGIPADSVAFTQPRIIVRERDPAVQIDILRYNPGEDSLDVRYDIVDVSASEGEDYFAPSRRQISFGPGQRNARLLIPLVQDTLTEGDESFVIELESGVSHEDTVNRAAVTIRDDDGTPGID